MGVWGTKIFSDDLACDIRNDYELLLGDGLRGSEATKRILSQYKSSRADPDESSRFWLALAAAQWKNGRLEQEVLSRAIKIIDSGEDLEHWDTDSPDFAARRRALDHLRVQLLSPQPAESKVEKRTPSKCQWKKGDLISYRLKSGRLIVFCVTGHFKDKGGTYPNCEILDWVGSELLPSKELQALHFKRSRDDYRHTITHLMIVGASKGFSERTSLLQVRRKPSQKREPCSVVHVKHLDAFLKEWFLLD